MTQSSRLKDILDESIVLLKTSRTLFRHSMEACTAIGIKNDYSTGELDQFEALTARFARISDICTQKVMRTLFQLLREDCPTFLDRAATAEKIGMIKSADDLVVIRDLRNTIAHEYVLEALNDVFRTVLEYSPVLDGIIDAITLYAESKKNLPG